MLYRFNLLLMIASVVAGFLLAGGCTQKNDISGVWKGKITLPSTAKTLTELEFSLTQKGNEVTGAMIFTKPEAKLPLTGTFKEGKMSLTSPLKNGLAVSITATLENRGKFRGEAVLDYDTPQLGKRQDKALLELTR